MLNCEALLIRRQTIRLLDMSKGTICPLSENNASGSPKRDRLGDGYGAAHEG